MFRFPLRVDSGYLCDADGALIATGITGDTTKALCAALNAAVGFWQAGASAADAPCDFDCGCAACDEIYNREFNALGNLISALDKIVKSDEVKE